MQNWDYAWCGYYYITICTRNRECYFDKIVAGQMVLSEMGEIAKSEWLKSPEIRPEMNLNLDIFEIMPNHIHGIIKIGKNKFGPQRKNVSSIIRGFKSAVTINARKINSEFGWEMN